MTGKKRSRKEEREERLENKKESKKRQEKLLSSLVALMENVDKTVSTDAEDIDDFWKNKALVSQ